MGKNLEFMKTLAMYHEENELRFCVLWRMKACMLQMLNKAKHASSQFVTKGWQISR